MPSAPRGISVEELAVDEACSALGSDFTRFRDRVDRWTPLHEPSYLRLWERILGSQHDCRIVVAWGATGELAGYAPLMRVRGQFGPVPVATLRFIGNNVGYPGDILYSEVFSRTGEGAPARAILGHVASTWSLGKWELGYVSPSSATFRAVTDVLGDGFVAPDSHGSVPYVSVLLPEDWSSYVASLTANTRSSYRRGVKHLDAQGALEVVVDTSPTRVRRRVGELIRNHMRWLSGTDREGWFGDGNVKNFLVSAAELLAQKGKFVSSALELDGIPIAWIVGPAHGRTCFEQLSSYDRTHAGDSPGLVLGLELIRALISRGFRRVDLGPGTTLFKKRLGGVERPYVRILGYQGWVRRVASARRPGWRGHLEREAAAAPRTREERRADGPAWGWDDRVRPT